MPSPLRIVVADRQSEMREFYRSMLPKMGHRVVAVVETGNALIERCLMLKPDLVITDFQLLDMDALDAVEELYLEHRVPVIILTAEHQPSQIKRAIDDHAMAYLRKPTGKVELEAEIPLVVRRFQEMEALRRKVDGWAGEESSLRGAEDYMGIQTLQRGGKYVITSDRNMTAAPTSRAPKPKLSGDYREVWTGDAWSLVQADAMTFDILDDADEYVKANYARLNGQ